MNEFDNNSARNFFSDLENIANATLGPKYGIVVKLSSEKLYYDKITVECKLEAIKTETDQLGYTVKSAEQVDFERNAHRFGFKPEDYKCKIICGSHEGILIGFKPKARKNKYLVEIDKQIYVTSKVQKI